MPERAAEIEVGLLPAIEQLERDELCDDAAGGGDQHRRRRQLDGVAEAHGAHDQNQDRHAGKKDAVQERADDLGARMSEGALQIGRTAGDARGDERKKNAADGGERVKGVEMTAIEPE
jgi:hypothetical protein